MTDNRIGQILENLEDQRRFILSTLRILNEQMAIVERCIQGLCVSIKDHQTALSDQDARAVERQTIHASV